MAKITPINKVSEKMLAATMDSRGTEQKEGAYAQACLSPEAFEEAAKRAAPQIKAHYQAMLEAPIECATSGEQERRILEQIALGSRNVGCLSAEASNEALRATIQSAKAQRKKSLVTRIKQWFLMKDNRSVPHHEASMFDGVSSYLKLLVANLDNDPYILTYTEGKKMANEIASLRRLCESALMRLPIEDLTHR